MRRIVIIVLTCLVGANALAQQYPFVHYTPKDGLVNNRARFMFQDSKGLLYISTFGGLSVYDGSRFTNYTTREGLSTNMVNDIIEMGQDSLWIISNTSKIHFLVRGRIGDVKTSDGYCPGINKMIKCSDGHYYAAAGEGLYRLEKNRFLKIVLKDDSGRVVEGFFSRIKAIKNKIFLITDPNMQTVTGPGRMFIYDVISKKATVSKSFFIFDAVLSPAGDLLVSTLSGIRKLDEPSLQKNQITLIDPPPVYLTLKHVIASYTFFDAQKNFWICSSKGVIRVDSLGSTRLFARENGLPLNTQSAVFQDRENTIWFVNEQTGVSKLTNPALEFYDQIIPGFTAVDIYTDPHTDGVWFLDPARNEILVHYRESDKLHQISSPFSNPPSRFLTRDNNRNYVLDLFNIYACNFSGRGKLSLKRLYADTTRNTNIGLSSIISDGHHNLIACNEKLIVVLQSGKTIQYPLGYFADQLALTADRKLWVITRARKLFLFQLHPEDPLHYLQLIRTYSQELPPIDPRSIAADKNGNLWIGTRDQGLFRLLFDDDFSLKSWNQVTTADGLTDNFVSYLHLDEDNKIWACSTAGLDQVEFKDGRIAIENITLGNNSYQHISKILTTRQGVHWALSRSGVLKISPFRSPPNSYRPKIMFREIREGTHTIDQANSNLSFDHDRNNISFRLAVPSFIDEKQSRFTYLLEGGSTNNWSDPSSSGTINFVNLSPGKYVLRVKAAFINHRYADTEVSYSFRILPPWWQTWWFRSLIFGSLVLIIWLIARSYYRQKLTEQRMSLEKQQAIERERSRIAADMHDELGSGLSAIRFLGERVKRNVFSEVTREDIEKMQVTSNELIDKMNEIIWTMNEKNDSLENLIFYTRSYTVEYCAENNLECLVNLPEIIPSVPLSGETRRNIFLVVKESLHNIVKHADAKNVEFEVTINRDLGIMIRDDGAGFKENGYPSSGNGLKNMQKRIESLGGSLGIENNKGLTVIINIPLGPNGTNEHPGFRL